MTYPLQCTCDDVRRWHLRDGMVMSTADKIVWFEEVVALMVRFGVRDRLRDLSMERNDGPYG